ncbi:hypothetical protein HAX54_002470 [Datura stramonium]|uniref:Uncharacterized protein n=1 Tax=Datura stramonium TaxID=4076 RepID=A0ABS8RVA8_DATST|nr:hypothetical protein [Datura stramonium]
MIWHQKFGKLKQCNLDSLTQIPWQLQLRCLVVDSPFTSSSTEYRGMIPVMLRPPTVPQVLRGYGLKPGRPAWTAVWLRDVNILDGTIMALDSIYQDPRMKNNGNLVASETQLELDVALDLPLPSILVGIYLTGGWLRLQWQKFGQHEQEAKFPINDSLLVGFGDKSNFLHLLLVHHNFISTIDEMRKHLNGFFRGTLAVVKYSTTAPGCREERLRCPCSRSLRKWVSSR